MSASSRTTVSLSDDQIRGRLTPAEAVGMMRDALVDAHRGAFTAPPRVFETDGAAVGRSGPAQSVAVADTWYGYVSSDEPTEVHADTASDSVVVVHDRATGTALAMAVGSELADLRLSGTIGAAAELLAAQDASVLAVLGGGRSVIPAIAAIASVRPLAQVRTVAAAETHEHAGFDALAVPVLAEATAGDAMVGASIVLILPSATTPAPILPPAALEPGCTVLVIGHPAAAGQDFSADLIAALDVLVTDSPAQLAAYEGWQPLTARLDEVVHLGSIADGAPLRLRPAQRVGFFSAGLTAAEAFLLQRLALR